MTYKEKLKELIGENPKVFDDDYGGGVLKCPGNYFSNAMHKLNCNLGTYCTMCWNKEYTGENYIGEYPLITEQVAKFDHDKPRLSLVPMQIVWDVAEIREYGTKKYKDPDNWKRVEMDRYVDALLRHTLAFVEDHDSVDEESGLAHYKHMACNMAFLCHLFKEGVPFK